MRVDFDLKVGTKITLGQCFRGFPNCLGWYAEGTNKKYIWHNTNDLWLMGEELEIELFEIEKIVKINDEDFIVKLKVDYDLDDEMTDEECIKSILECFEIDYTSAKIEIEAL